MAGQELNYRHCWTHYTNHTGFNLLQAIGSGLVKLKPKNARHNHVLGPLDGYDTLNWLSACY